MVEQPQVTVGQQQVWATTGLSVLAPQIAIQDLPGHGPASPQLHLPPALLIVCFVFLHQAFACAVPSAQNTPLACLCNQQFLQN